MDPAAKTNLLLFGGSMLVLAAFWLILSGVSGGGALSIAAGVIAGVGAVALFRVFARSRKDQ